MAQAEQTETTVDFTAIPQPLPPRRTKVGVATVAWWEGKPGDIVVMAEGGTIDDRYVAEQVITAQLAQHGFKRAQFSFDVRVRTATWDDIMGKAKRLVQSGNVTVLRNGYNNIVGHVVGDHGEYTTEVGRDDPDSRAITTWTCECPWDQYAWQRTRKWKKYEGRPCAHVLALYWKALSTPLDEDAQGNPPDPGQMQGPPPTPAPAGPPGPGGMATPMHPDELPGPAPVPAGAGPPGPPSGASPMAPPGSPEVLPPSPADQLAMMQPPIPGSVPSGQPANPNTISVPGAKMPGPFNPVQYPGGTYSRVSAEFNAPEIVRLKDDGYGIAEGKDPAAGAGQYQVVPAGSNGEVLSQDEATGWVEVIFPLHDSGENEPYHIRMFCEPGQLEHSRQRPPGEFIKRRY